MSILMKWRTISPVHAQGAGMSASGCRWSAMTIRAGLLAGCPRCLVPGCRYVQFSETPFLISPLGKEGSFNEQRSTRDSTQISGSGACRLDECCQQDMPPCRASTAPEKEVPAQFSRIGGHRNTRKTGGNVPGACLRRVGNPAEPGVHASRVNSQSLVPSLSRAHAPGEHALRSVLRVSARHTPVTNRSQSFTIQD